MTTITREQLRERAREKVKSLEFAVTQTAFSENRAELEEELELARIALASLEAEPVGTFRKGPCGYSPSFHEDAMPLYAAPPAPVSVPAAMEIDDDFDSAFEHGKAVGWNACRAAILQGANGTLTNEGTITATQFKPVADLYGLTSPTGGETSFTFDAVEARDFIDGGWSCQEYVELERFQEAITNHTEDKLTMVDHSGDSNNMVEPVTTAYKLPPHIFRELVNRLRDTAVKYQGCQQLREQLSRTLQEVIQPAAPQQDGE